MKLLHAVIVLFSVLIFSQMAHAKGDVNQRTYTAHDFIDLEIFPDWFQKSIVREKKVKKKSRLKIKQFNINKKVLGKVKLAEQDDDYWYYNIDIGTDSPVECFVLTSFDGPSNSMHAIVENSLSGVESLNKKKLSSKFNYAVGSGVTGSAPYLLLDTFYNLGEGNSKVTGILKALSAETDQSLQICMHNEVGYRETFFSVFESFISAFTENQESPEFFKSITQMTLNNIPVGYSLERFTTDKDGDIEILSQASMMIPVDNSSVSRSDTKKTSWSIADGALINAREYSVTNGVLASEFSIQYQDDKWQVKGQLQGKEINSEWQYNDWLLSDYGTYLGITNLNESDQNSAEYLMWLSEADPLSAQSVTISKLVDNPDANFKIKIGPIDMQFMTEDNGSFIRGSMQQGPVMLNLKRIFIKGEPTLP